MKQGSSGSEGWTRKGSGRQDRAEKGSEEIGMANSSINAEVEAFIRSKTVSKQEKMSLYLSLTVPITVPFFTII